MKILLTAINAKYIHSNPAVYSLAAYADKYLTSQEKEKCQVEIAEYTINQRTEEILADLYKKKSEVLALSCYIWNWEMVQEVMTEFHKLLPGVPVYLGGPEVSYTAEKILRQYPFLAGIMIGEGEETFLEICRFYAKKGVVRELPKIMGLVRGSGLTACSTDNLNRDFMIPGEPRGLVNINDIPFFYNDMSAFEHRIVYYESSRGCPFRCSYCLSSIDKTVRLRDLELVKNELQFFLDHKIPQVKFIDRTFNCNHDHACAVWQYLLENDNGVTNFHFEIAADILTEKELSILEKMRPGLVQLEIGVQSANMDTIREINRVMNLSKLKENVAKILAAGNIHQHLDLIAGLPLEDYDSFVNSFNEVYGMKPHQLQLGFLKVLKGSKMREKALEYGIAYTDKAPYEVLYTSWISYEEIRRLKQVEEMVELYYNSNQFTDTLAMLEKEFDSPFAMYEALAEYYEEKGYGIQSPARSSRYRILLDFCCIIMESRQEISKTEDNTENNLLIKTIGLEKIEMYRELLTFDLYLREKIKTRPDFAKGQENIKEFSREFYQREEEERKLLPAYTDYNSRQLAKMTHLEEFTYSVWEKGNCRRLEQPKVVLFDYQVRNPLTGDARFVIV